MVKQLSILVFVAAATLLLLAVTSSAQPVYYTAGTFGSPVAYTAGVSPLAYTATAPLIASSPYAYSSYYRTAPAYPYYV